MSLQGLVYSLGVGKKIHLLLDVFPGEVLSCKLTDQLDN